MSPEIAVQPSSETTITVRYWASARSAAGVDHDLIEALEPLTLAEIHRQVLTRHPGRLESVLALCSVLVGDRPVSTEDAADVIVQPGSSVEFLPPFAGG